MSISHSTLRERQAWPLEQKIDHTVGAIDAFLAYCREHDRTPYVSFSGGLDSTVLLHLARRVFGADIKGVFCSTGNEFPEVVRFVRHTPNVEIIHPALTPPAGNGAIRLSAGQQGTGASCSANPND